MPRGESRSDKTTHWPASFLTLARMLMSLAATRQKTPELRNWIDSSDMQ